MANNVNEAIATIRTRYDAVCTIEALYGFCETDIGRQILLAGLENMHPREIAAKLPDEILKNIAIEQLRVEWEGV